MRPAGRPDIFVFDVGNVILSFRPREFLGDRPDAEAIRQVVFESAEWLEMDRGTLSPERATEIFCARAPRLAEAIRATMAGYLEMFRPIEGTIALIGDLARRGHDLYYLSNFHEKASEVVVAKYPVFSLFRGGVFSWRVKRIKPDPAIYRRLLEEYGLEPRRCAFVDDVEENVAAAEALGMRGIRFTTPEALRSELM